MEFATWNALLFWGLVGACFAHEMWRTRDNPTKRSMICAAYRKAFPVVLRNQHIVFGIFSILHRVLEPSYSYQWFRFGLAGSCLAVSSTVLHEFVHSTPWLYANVHKVHHEFVTPNALASEYNSVADTLMNFINTAMVIYIAQIPRELVYMFLAFTNFSVVLSHHPPWPGSKHHLVHHTKGKVNFNFSLTPLVDDIMGTRAPTPTVA